MNMASPWLQTPDLGQINRSHQDTAVAQLGIEFTVVGTNSLTARMPVDTRTRQPAGLLHGGASLLLAETLASCAAWQTIDRSRYTAVGIEINANHVRGVREGSVIGTVHPVHLGRTSQIWEVRIVDAADRLVCVSRATVSILEITRPS
jgi:1,4-dihydroxy-2-naphthoyl-CoA hydrolase